MMKVFIYSFIYLLITATFLFSKGNAVMKNAKNEEKRIQHWGLSIQEAIRLYLRIGLASSSSDTRRCQAVLKSSRKLDYQLNSRFFTKSIENHNLMSVFSNEFRITMAVSKSDQQIILWIPGSKDFSGYIRKNWKIISEQFRSNLWKEFQKGTSIGEFWSIAYRDFFHESNLKSIIEKKIKSQQGYCNYNLMLAGHSVGGAMAELLALFIVKEHLWPRKRLRLLTFAAPRVGDENYAAMLTHLFPWKYRYVWEDDPLVNIPFNECFNTKQRPQLNANWDLERKEKCFFHSGKTLYGRVFNGMTYILKVLYDDYDGITPGRELKYDGYGIEDPQYFENYLCCESDSECGPSRICDDNECRPLNIHAWNITKDTPIRTTTSTKPPIIPPAITTTTQIGGNSSTSQTSTTVPTLTTSHESHKCIMNDILDQPAGGPNSVDEGRALYLLLNFSSPDFAKNYNTYNDFYIDILNKTICPFKGILFIWVEDEQQEGNDTERERFKNFRSKIDENHWYVVTNGREEKRIRDSISLDQEGEHFNVIIGKLNFNTTDQIQTQWCVKGERTNLDIKKDVERWKQQRESINQICQEWLKSSGKLE